MKHIVHLIQRSLSHRRGNHALYGQYCTGRFLRNNLCAISSASAHFGNRVVRPLDLAASLDSGRIVEVFVTLAANLTSVVLVTTEARELKVEEDYAKACEWDSRSADKGSSHAPGDLDK